MTTEPGHGDTEESDQPTSESARRPWVFLAVLGTALLVAMASAIGTGLGSGVLDLFGGDPGESPTTGRLELATVDVRNERPNPRSGGNRSSDGAAAEQPRQSTPTVDITLLNGGSHRAIVTGARIDVEAYAELNKCVPMGGGDIVIAGRYDIPLPDNPRGRERRIDLRLRQQIGPDEVERFALRFAAPDFHDQYSLYLLHIRLLTTEARRIVDAGRVLISTPQPLSTSAGPTGAAFYLPVDDIFLAPPPEGIAQISAQLAWCFRRNLEVLRRIVRSPRPRRDKQVAAMSSVEPASRWSALNRSFPAREAAMDLAQADSGDPVLGVYAAEQTGDHAFVMDIQRRSASALVQRAKRWLADGERSSRRKARDGGRYEFGEAASDARASLELRRTLAAHHVLSRAKRRLATFTRDG